MTTSTGNSQEQYEEQQFVKSYSELKLLESKGAGIKADMGVIYSRLKDMGWSKQDFVFARSLQDKDVGEVIADLEKKIRIARVMGHPLGRQLSLLDSDPASEDEKAYEEGYLCGKLRKENRNPYDIGSDKGQGWQRGFNEGNSFVNQDLSAVINPGD